VVLGRAVGGGAGALPERLRVVRVIGPAARERARPVADTRKDALIELAPYVSQILLRGGGGRRRRPPAGGAEQARLIGVGAMKDLVGLAAAGAVERAIDSHPSRPRTAKAAVFAIMPGVCAGGRSAAILRAAQPRSASRDRPVEIGQSRSAQNPNLRAQAGSARRSIWDPVRRPAARQAAI
jgi:hypothetical protein